MKKTITKLTSVALAIILSLSLSVSAIAAGIPSPSDKPNKANIMTLLQTYLPDIYTWAKATEKSDYSFMSFFNNSSFYEDFGTAVHETYHMYSNNIGIQKGTYGTYIPVNGKAYYIVPDKSKIFKTEKMAPTIPSYLRTFRYDLYTSGESYSNSSGAIGCLEEMTAYYYGLYASTHLIDYLLQYDDGGAFSNFAVDVANDQCAYVEFRFFILNYLLFARQYFPETYKYLMTSKEFTAAYTDVCEAFEVEIDTVKKRLPEINYYLSTHFGAELVMTDQDFAYYRNGNFIKGAPLNDYTLLSAELSKSKYADMESTIKKPLGRKQRLMPYLPPLLMSSQQTLPTKKQNYLLAFQKIKTAFSYMLPGRKNMTLL